MSQRQRRERPGCHLGIEAEEAMEVTLDGI